MVEDEALAGDEDDFDVAAPFDLSGMQAGDELGDEYEDDVDGIVDPLAGMRSDEDDAPGYSDLTEGDDALDLTSDYADYGDAPAQPAVQDDLLASADRLASEDQPVTARLGGRRRGLLGGASDEGGTGAGSTLFERMANLSRSTGRDDEEEDEGEDGPALSIPRFLDRNRNQ
jgi:cell division protein FtsZ